MDDWPITDEQVERYARNLARFMSKNPALSYHSMLQIIRHELTHLQHEAVRKWSNIIVKNQLKVPYVE
jgi:hypothetical protein